jgi:N-acylethanolamine-hydrolysing acid amidase
MVPLVNASRAASLMDFIPEEYEELVKRLPWRGPGCTGIIARDSSDGSVWHARNLDFFPSSVMEHLVYDAVFTKGGKELFRAQSIAGYTMLITGARDLGGKDGYVVERNTRYTNHWGGNKEMFRNLESGREMNGWTLRKIMETTPDYETAVEQIKKAKFVSTEYSIISGVRKGVIVSKSPEGFVHEQVLGEGADSQDYILITNFDYFWHDVREYFDPTGHGGFFLHPTRRQEAQRLLNAALQERKRISPDDLFATLNAKYVIADTVFQGLFNVEKGVWNASQPVLDDAGASSTDGLRAAQPAAQPEAPILV